MVQKGKAGLSLHKLHQAKRRFTHVTINQLNCVGVTEVASVCQLETELISSSKSQANRNATMSCLGKVQRE
jgi:hypothetical protein